MARLHTAKWFEHRVFLRTCLGGEHLQKGTILYWVWRDDRWLLVTKSCVCMGVVSYVLGDLFLYFSTPRTEMWAFSETDFWIYSVTLCFDRPNLISTCMVCLCKYHNWVTQGVGRLLNLVVNLNYIIYNLYLTIYNI
jgi:hypothetical protein